MSEDDMDLIFEDDDPRPPAAESGTPAPGEVAAALRILAPGDDDNVTLGEIRADLRASLLSASPASETQGPGEGDLRGEDDTGPCNCCGVMECRCGLDGSILRLIMAERDAAVERCTLAEQKVARVEEATLRQAAAAVERERVGGDNWPDVRRWLLEIAEDSAALLVRPERTAAEAADALLRIGHRDAYNYLEANGYLRSWRPGDPCASCGSTDTGMGLPHEGAFCRNCGRSDDDE